MRQPVLNTLPADAAALFDSVLNATGDGVAVVDSTGRYLYYNAQFCKLWHIDASLIDSGQKHAIQDALLALVVERDRFRALVKELTADPSRSAEAIVELTDGRAIEGQTVPQRLGGELVGRVWWFRDVTDRRRIESELRTSEERFAHLFLASPFSILLATYPEGRIVAVNPAFSRLFDRRREDVVGKTTSEINLWADSADREQMLAQLKAGRPVEGMEFAFTTAAGDLRVVYLSIELVQLHGQWHALASSVDVTAAKGVEAALRESETKYRTLFDAIADTVYLLAFDGALLALNEAFERMTGFRREEWIGRSFAELVHPDDRGRALAMFAAVLANHTAAAEDFRILRRDGGYLVAECTPAYPLREGDRVTGFLGTGRDVTHQRQLERTIRQAQKMEALGTLAGGIAHDFNNILTAIGGHAEFLQRQVASDAEAIADVVGILDATRRAKALVRQILTFGRQRPEERQVVNLPAVVREASSLLRATLPTTITIDTAFAEDVAIVGDPTQVHQVIVNLGTNALHAMRESGGRLSIAVDCVDLAAADAARIGGHVSSGRYARLSVTDTGHGMSEATLARVFDPFFTTKPQTEGSGLGLAVVHGIMRGHGGDIVVTSELGRGTTATAYFPRAAGGVQGAQGGGTAVPLGAGQRVMVVDDESALVLLGTRMAMTLGYRAAGFQSPTEALAAFRADSRGFDLLLTDLTMPGMTGSELAREAIAIRPDLPVIIASGYPGALSAEEMKASGIREVVSKPFDLKAVADALARGFRS